MEKTLKRKNPVISLHKTIIHILNKEQQNLTLTDYEIPCTLEIDKMFTKLIKSVQRNESLRKATFNQFSKSKIKTLTEDIIYDEDSFVEKSQDLAQLLFDKTIFNEETESCSFAVTLFSEDDELKVGLFKLDFKKNLSSEISLKDNGVVANIVQSNNSLSANLKSTQAAIIGVSGLNDEYHLEILDKNSKEVDSPSVFIDKFLEAKKMEEDKHRMMKFKETVDTFLTLQVSNLKEAEDARSILQYHLETKESIKAIDFVEKALVENSSKEALKEILEEKNLSKAIKIDKDFAKKKTKKTKKHLDTGFVLTGETALFDDPTKYQIHVKEDGSIDITLKNVSFIETSN